MERRLRCSSLTRRAAAAALLLAQQNTLSSWTPRAVPLDAAALGDALARQC
jgi:hypothetical protein